MSLPVSLPRQYMQSLQPITSRPSILFFIIIGYRFHMPITGTLPIVRVPGTSTRYPLIPTGTGYRLSYPFFPFCGQEECLFLSLLFHVQQPALHQSINGFHDTIPLAAYGFE